MGVSVVGQGIQMSAIRHAIATAAVFLALFYYFYGPPLTPAMAQAAQDRCNDLTGSAYRNYHLEWQTTTYSGLHQPHWECFDLRTGENRSYDLGWWVDL